MWKPWISLKFGEIQSFPPNPILPPHPPLPEGFIPGSCFQDSSCEALTSFQTEVFWVSRCFNFVSKINMQNKNNLALGLNHMKAFRVIKSEMIIISESSWEWIYKNRVSISKSTTLRANTLMSWVPKNVQFSNYYNSWCLQYFSKTAAHER